MAAQRTSFEKLQRDRAKKAKAAAKRERRLERSAEAAESARNDGLLDEAEAAPGEELSAAELLARIESIHKQFEAETISYEVFEEKKAELMARLTID